MVKEFWKSVSISQSYRQKWSGNFFLDTVYIGDGSNSGSCPWFNIMELSLHDAVVTWWLLHRPVLKTRHPSSSRICLPTLGPYKKSHHRSKSDANGTIF